MELWGKVEIRDNLVYFWQIGKLCIWIRKEGKEWFIKNDFGKNSKIIIAERSKVTPDSKWIRIIDNNSTEFIKFIPIMPNRQIVIETKNTNRILPGQEGRFFIELPLFIKITTGNNFQSELIEFPTENLSKTWSGGFTDGILSFSLEKQLYSDKDKINKNMNNVICPIKIVNKTRIIFDFKKVGIFSQYLKIFKGNSCLWTNELVITYMDDNKIDLEIKKNKPGYEKDMKIISNFREKYDKSIFKKSFNILRTITGL